MNVELLDKIDALKKEIENSEEYKELLRHNEILENSDDIKILSYRKDVAIFEYQEALKHFNKNSIEVIGKEKVMAKSIYDLNNHELVKNYNKAFASLNSIYKEINVLLFDFYKKD